MPDRRNRCGCILFGVDEDIELAQAWRAGDQGAGNQLFRRYFTPVYRFFRNKIDGNVDDLVQETFAGCQKSRDRIRSDDGFRAYLFGVARNVLHTHLRKKYSGVGGDLSTTSVIDMGTSPSAHVARRREHRLLLEALRSLPLDDQVALELSYWEDLRARQIAVVLGVSAEAAQSRLRRARALLAERVQKLAGTAVQSTQDDLQQWAASVREYIAAQ